MSRLALITFITRDGTDIDNGLPAGGGGRPDNSLPSWERPVDPGYGRPNWSGNRPDNSLPWVPPPGHIATLPVFPFDPTKPEGPDKPEGPEGPGKPDDKPPVQIKPGAKFVVKWLACTGLILVPDHELPASGAEPK